MSSKDRLFDARPYGKDSILVVGVRADSTYCKPGAPLLFGIPQGNACIADNSIEMWDRAGNLLWKRFQKIEFPSCWFGATILSNGDILTAGLINRDTLEFDTSNQAFNPLVQTARISRWSRAGDLIWSWRITSFPMDLPKGVSWPSIHWTDTLNNGDIVFLGQFGHPRLIIPQADTLDLSAHFSKTIYNTNAYAGILGCLSSQGTMRWIKPFSVTNPAFSRPFSNGLPDGASVLVRDNEILLARSAPTDTLGNTKVLLGRYDATGSLLSESSPLDTTTASVHGMAEAEDGTLLLSVRPQASSVHFAGQTLSVPADSAYFNGPNSAPATGRNLLLLLDSSLTPLLAKPLTGWRRPGSWNVGRAPGHGWLAWGENWSGILTDTANLLLLDDSLKVLDTSPLLANVMSVHAYGDELWLSGSVQGASLVGNQGTMRATRMEFDPPKPVRLHGNHQAKSSLWQKGNRIGWNGSSPARLRILKASGQQEADVWLNTGETLPLTSGLHLIQLQSQGLKESRVLAIP